MKEAKKANEAVKNAEVKVEVKAKKERKPRNMEASKKTNELTNNLKKSIRNILTKLETLPEEHRGEYAVKLFTLTGEWESALTQISAEIDLIKTFSLLSAEQIAILKKKF